MVFIGGQGVDYVFDFVGVLSVGLDVVGMVVQCGIVVIVGLIGLVGDGFVFSIIMGKEFMVVGLFNGDIFDYVCVIDFFMVFVDCFFWDDLFSVLVGFVDVFVQIVYMYYFDEVKVVIDLSF